jgi:site-specific recombinase XerC
VASVQSAEGDLDAAFADNHESLTQSRAAGEPERSDLDLQRREIYIRGKHGKDRIVRIDHETARRVDRYLGARARHPQAHRSWLWLGTGGCGPLARNGIYQMVRRRGGQAGVPVYPHRFRHHFSHTWLERSGAEGDLMELNGWSSSDTTPLERMFCALRFTSAYCFGGHSFVIQEAGRPARGSPS